jgi:hypothetical protein
VVTVVTRGGQELTREMQAVPGGPSNPLSDEGLRQKLRRFAGLTLSPERLGVLEGRLLALEDVVDMSEVLALMRA